LQIVAASLLMIRAAGWNGDPARCALEADHIHNLPRLVHSFTATELKYYLEVSVPSYVSQTSDESNATFEPHWIRLREYVARSSS